MENYFKNKRVIACIYYCVFKTDFAGPERRGESW